MGDQAERRVLEMVEHGVLSAEEGLRLIDAMAVGRTDVFYDDEFAPDIEEVSAEDLLTPAVTNVSEKELARMKQLKRWWIFPFALGLLFTILGAYWMSTSYSRSGFGWGFWMSWIPFLGGIFVVAVSFQSSRNVWLHVRIKQKQGDSPERISISLPIPLTFTQWFISKFGQKIPGLKEQPLSETSDLLQKISPDEPFYIQVNDTDEGQRVEVFIG